MACVNIPIKGEILRLAVEDLPHPPGPLLEVLSAGSPPLIYWYETAVLYYNAGDLAGFETILRRIFSSDISGRPEYRDTESAFVRLRVQIATACYELLHGTASSTSQQTSALTRYNNAVAYITAAEQLSSALGGAFSSLVKAAKAAALLFREMEASAVRDSPLLSSLLTAHNTATAAATSPSQSSGGTATAAGGNNSGMALEGGLTGAAGTTVSFVPLLLVKAAQAVFNKQWAEGRTLYARVVRECPNAGAHVRVGLGVCLAALGHRDAAKAAFNRALQLQQDCVGAIAGLTSLEIMSLHDGSAVRMDAVARNKAYARVMDRLRKASTAVQGHPLALLNMAHAAFSCWVPLTNTTTGLPITAALIRGSRRMLFSEDVSGKLRPGETLRIAAAAVNVDGSQSTLLVPMRLTTGEHVATVPVRAIDNLAQLCSALIPAEASTVCVGRARLPWGLASIPAGAPVLVLDVERAKKLAKSAFEASKDDSLKAEALYALGRAMQAGGQYVDATIQYRRCLEYSPSFAAAHFGLAQTSIYQKRLDDATKHLNHVLTLKPDDRSACRTLAAVHLQLGRVEDATAMARKAHESAPWDVTTSALYAQLLARQDTPAALSKAYRTTENTIDKLRRLGMAVPAALINNCGVLAMRQAAHEPTSSKRRDLFALADGHFERASLHVAADMFPNLATTAELRAPDVREAASFSPAGVTITFNVARLAEVTGKVSDAEALQSKIVSRLPTYFDSYIRLALMAKQRGNVPLELELLQKSIDAAKSFISASSSAMAIAHAKSAIVTSKILRGQALECSGNLKDAKDAYASAIQESGQDADPYASLCLANAMFRDVYHADDAAREGILRDCFNAYKDVLKRFPHNVYAANGLGTVLAEQGRLEAAQAAFKVVREACQEAVPAAVNLGHITTALGDNGAALQLYHLAAKRCGEDSMEVSGTLELITTSAADATRCMMYQARAHMEAKEFEQAIETMRRVLLLRPHDPHARYILAYAEAEEALRIISMEISKRTADQVEYAVQLVRAARAGFGWLKQVCESTSSTVRANLQQSGVPLERVPAFFAHLERTLPIAETHLTEQKRRALQAQVDANELRSQMEMRMAERKEAEVRVEQEAKRARLAAQAAARELQEKLAAQAAQNGDDSADKENAKMMKARAKKKPRTQEDSSDSDTGSSSSGSDSAGSDSSDDEVNAAAREELAALFGDDNEGDDATKQTMEDLFGDDLEGLEPAEDVESGATAGSTSPMPPESAVAENIQRRPLYTSDSEGSDVPADAAPAPVSGRKRRANVLVDDDE